VAIERRFTCFRELRSAESEMPTKIFVGRLAEGTTSEDIGALFRKFGHVTECDVISNYGFVVSAGINIQGWWVKPLDSFTQFYPGQLGKTWVKLGKR